MKKFSVGIIGGSGCTGGEILRLLLHHPQCKITFVHSRSRAHQPVRNVHDDLFCDLHFTDQIDDQVDVIFLCTGHGEAKQYRELLTANPNLRIIDLTADHRFAADTVYGLTEWNRSNISESRFVANPGCFATAIQLALLPFAEKGLLQNDIHVHGITGATGAGMQLQATTQFIWRSENLSIYKAFEHQHLFEIQASLQERQAEIPPIFFIPVRGPLSRGIMTSVSFRLEMSPEQAQEVLTESYAHEFFVKVCPEAVHLKMVRNTNYACLHLVTYKGMVHISCVIDNLIKGAVGQAVQNMNVMLGIEEQSGLQLKPCTF